MFKVRKYISKGGLYYVKINVKILFGPIFETQTQKSNQDYANIYVTNIHVHIFID